MNFCENCGSPSGGDAFCTECGSPLGPDQGTSGAGTTQAMSPAVQPYAEPADEPRQRPTRRRRRMVPLAIGLVLLATAGAATWSVTSGQLPLLSSDPPRSEPSSGRGPDDTAESDRPSPEEPTTSRPPVQCWDDTEVERLAQCAMPTGAAGLRWVFPSITTLSACRTRRLVDRDQIACEDLDGTQYNFSSWLDPAALGAHYDDNSDSTAVVRPATANLPVHREWTYLTADTSLSNRFKVAVAYVDQPYSVTIYAATAEQRAAKLLDLEMRRAQEIAGITRRDEK